jgi:hypothetical protein
VPPAGFPPRPVNFFSPSHSGSGSSNRWSGFMCALRSNLRATGSIDFENTPYARAGCIRQQTKCSD